MSSRLIRLLAALIIGAAGGTVAMVAPASAAACPAGTGVTVVVNSSVSCDRNGGGSAYSNFGDAGYSLSNYRGFVCSINGYPDPAKACHSYAPADAYWALFWANGKGGGWNYSNSGASSLNVPTGGWVAFKFQNSSSRSYPGVRPYTPPPAPAPAPAPAPKPKPKPSAKPSASASASASAAAKAKAKAKATAKPSASASASAGASATPGDEVSNTSATTDSQGSNGMAWVGVALAVALLAGMGFAVWRRRSAGQP